MVISLFLMPGVFTMGVVRATEPAALVLQREGSTSPDVAVYSEIMAPAKVSLGRATKLVFIDFRSCMRVTVVGGSVEFDLDGYKSAGGTESHERVACPMRLVVRNGGGRSANVTAGSGGILRGGDQHPETATHPTFVLVGRRAAEFSAAEIFRNGTDTAAPLVASGNRFSLAPSSRDLTPGASYRLLLHSKDGAKVEIPLEADSGNGVSQVTVLQMD